MSNSSPSLIIYKRDPQDSDVDLKPMQFFKLLRRIFGYTKPFARTRNWLLVTVLLRAIQLPLIAWAIGAVINGPISHHHTRGILLGTLGFAALALVTQFTMHFRQRLALELGEAVIRDLRNDMFAHLQSLTASFYDKMKVGRIISRMSSDIEAIRLGVQDLVFISLVQLGQVIVCAALMAYYDLVLFLVVIAIAPIIWAINRHFRLKLSILQRQNSESFSRITATLAESVSGIRVTQGFVRQEVNAGLFKQLVTEHSKTNTDLANTSAVFLPLLDLNSQIFIAGLLLLGGWRVLSGATPIDSIVIFFFLANLFFEPVRVVGTLYTQALTAMVGAERVFRLLDTKPEWSDPLTAISLDEIKGRVEFHDLTFGYDRARPILKKINFIAAPGQTIALVGHTGSGKTSIINLIAKFYLPVSGQLLIDGHDITQIQSESLHRHLGLVHQHNFLFEGTVLDNIRFARPEASREEVIEAARSLNFLDLIEALPDGFDTKIGEAGSGLSIGQRQILCFTRALLANPRILILDEATSAIDAITEARLQRSLVELLRGRTSFVIAHRLSTIRNADCILVLDHGEIVERGTHAELLANESGIYRELHAQFTRSPHR